MAGLILREDGNQRCWIEGGLAGPSLGTSWEKGSENQTRDSDGRAVAGEIGRELSGWICEGWRRWKQQDLGVS